MPAHTAGRPSTGAASATHEVRGGDGMRRPLRVAAAQSEIVTGDLVGNVARHAGAVRAARARVVVFPEMSLTGYELRAPVVDPRDPALEPLVEACEQTGTLALVGAPIGAAASRHIGMLQVDATGVRVAYRKVHLGVEERRHLEPGDGTAVLDVDGWRVGLAICKDTSVASHDDALAAEGVQVYVAGVLEHARDVRTINERARRIADARGMWVVVASYAGGAPWGFDEAAGHSCICGPDARLRAAAGREPGQIVAEDLNPATDGRAGPG
jgi:predicted amidohydrolase